MDRRDIERGIELGFAEELDFSALARPRSARLRVMLTAPPRKMFASSLEKSRTSRPMRTGTLRICRLSMKEEDRAGRSRCAATVESAAPKRSKASSETTFLVATSGIVTRARSTVIPPVRVAAAREPARRRLSETSTSATFRTL